MSYSKFFLFIGLIAFFVFGSNFLVPKLPWLSIKTKQEMASLRQENEALKAEVLEWKLSAPENQTEYKAKVYSVYPFNNQSELTITGGTLQGLKEGQPVTIGSSVLVGYIARTFESYSIVKTVFDDAWQVAVRIGESATDGLLVGGRTPELTLIGKHKTIQEGEIVYSASKSFPYGLTLGKVGAIKDSANTLFKEAALTPSYTLNDLSEVTVLLR